MFVIELIYALFIGLSVAWLFTLFVGSRGPWNSFFWFFMVIFLFSWGGGLWVRPFGPTGWGVAWLPFLLMGVFISILLSATTPRAARRRMIFKGRGSVAPKIKEQVAEENSTETTIDVLFWILIVVMTMAIFGHYTWHPHPMG